MGCELIQPDLQLTVPQFRYWTRPPLNLVPSLMLGPPPSRSQTLPYFDVLAALQDPAFLAWKFRQQIYEGPSQPKIDFSYHKPPSGPYPNLLMINPIELDAASITLDAVMKVPAVHHWLDMVKKKIVSDKKLTAIGIGLATVAAGTGIALYETGRVKSLPELTIPFGSLNLKGTYRKEIKLELEFDW